MNVRSILKLASTLTDDILATWDSPPEPDSYGYAAFEDAFDRFLGSKNVIVPKLSRSEEERRDKRGGAKKWTSDALGIPEDGLYDIEQSKDLKLMDFQVCETFESISGCTDLVYN